MEEVVITYRNSPAVSNEALNGLYRVSWTGHTGRDFQPILQRSLVYTCAYDDEELVGFVYLAWDGGSHAFLLDPTVHPRLRRRGLGQELVRQVVLVAQERDLAWIHVDFEPHLRTFYEQCGFRPTEAGLIRLPLQST